MNRRRGRQKGRKIGAIRRPSAAVELGIILEWSASLNSHRVKEGKDGGRKSPRTDGWKDRDRCMSHSPGGWMTIRNSKLHRMINTFFIIHRHRQTDSATAALARFLLGVLAPFRFPFRSSVSSNRIARTAVPLESLEIESRRHRASNERRERAHSIEPETERTKDVERKADFSSRDATDTTREEREEREAFLRPCIAERLPAAAGAAAAALCLPFDCKYARRSGAERRGNETKPNRNCR